MSEWQAEFARILTSRVVIATMGNELRADDAFGPMLAARLCGAVVTPVFDCGMTPENWTGPIVELAPRCVVLVDCVEMGEPPGTVKLFAAEEASPGGASTHCSSVALLAALLAERTGADVYLIGVQPHSVEFGAPMSEAVEKALDEVVQVFLDLLPAPGGDGPIRGGTCRST